MTTSNKVRALVVTSDLGDSFKLGQKLTRSPAIAAYLLLSLNTPEREIPIQMSTDETMAIYNKIAGEWEGEDDDLVLEVNDAMLAYATGNASGEDEPNISAVSAAHRQAEAHTLGLKLGADVEEHIAEFLAANLTVKKGPIVMMDDINGRLFSDNPVTPAFTSEQIDAMPFPGSKPPKNADLSITNVQYDYYKVTISGETVRSSWYKDMLLSRTTTTALQDQVDKIKQIDGPNEYQKVNEKKTNESLLNAAITAFRKGFALDRVIRFIQDNIKTLTVEVQRNIDGSPLSTFYPFVVEQRGARTLMKAITVSQMIHLFDRSEINPDYTRIELVKVMGGTLEAFLKYGLPKKKRGRKEAPVVTDNKQAIAFMFAVGNYLTQATSGPLKQLLELKGQEGEHYVSAFGDAMSVLAPIWDMPSVRVAYDALQTAKKKTAA